MIGSCDSRRMTTTSIEQLEREIERLVRAHVEACHRAAAAAVERAFGTTAPRARSPQTRPSSRATGARRTPDEIAALGERLFRTICEHPGETMAVLAPRVGAKSAELHRPMTVLKRAGRIRSAGQKHQTRYFPMAPRGR